MARPTAVILGSGPNGLSASIALAQEGISVQLIEGADKIGGGARSAELTLPGFLHDVCSAVHPMALASPFFQSLPLAEHGLRWVHSPVPLAHPLDDGPPILLESSLQATAKGLGSDAAVYERMLCPFVNKWSGLVREILQPPHWPRFPFLLSRFARIGLPSALRVARRCFSGKRARALWAGLAAHSALPLQCRPSSAIAMVLACAAHVGGWPIAEGGSQNIPDALASLLRSFGGSIQTGQPIRSLSELPSSRGLLLDVGPAQLLQLAPQLAATSYGRALQRFRYGPGAFKIDYALAEPVPWRDAECRLAATVHLGGSLEDIARSEELVWQGEHPDRPFVLLAQPSLFDAFRAPKGKHTAWAYCHVPNGSAQDMTSRIEAQIERFAPGFREIILARHARTAAESALQNPNLVGGDIAGGALSGTQWLFRPAIRLNPYSTSLPGVYLCSASTPPGPGVHGMCGALAAREALRRL